ncbi:MAG TPA: type II toxin-antitoxin system prevent-host-death family antitoxin [Allocoleopsis sp.]
MLFTIQPSTQKLEQIMAQVCDDNHPVIITRNDQPSVVIISLENYQFLEENAYLLRSHKKFFPATKLDEVAGCLNYQGKAKTIE